jgi:hypothetical protein
VRERVEEPRARIYKRLRRPGINFKEPIQTGWESIPGLIKRFTNSGSGTDSKAWIPPGWELIPRLLKTTTLILLDS